jgi:hypothetical protein
MTPARNDRPTRRVLVSRCDGTKYAVELSEDLIVIRRKGTRRGGPTEVAFTPGQLVLQGVRARVEAERMAKRRARGGRRR